MPTLKTPCIAGFGEVMLRLAPEGFKRLSQVLPGQVEATFGGAEANVCAAVSYLGGQSRFLTALPDTPVSQAFATQLRGIGCDVSAIHYDTRGRMGIYFVETGSMMRGGSVVYDRSGSTIATLRPEEYDFQAMLKGATHLHLTGITPALSRNAFESTLAIAQCASDMGIAVSVDLNFRSKLWDWEEGTGRHELAARCMAEIVPFADIIFSSEGTTMDVFGIKAPGSSSGIGRQDTEVCLRSAQLLAERFPKAKLIAYTLRESISADHNNFGGMLYDTAARKAFFAPRDADGKCELYPMRDIVDRIGGGDAFDGALLYALTTPELADFQTAINFAAAAGAMSHAILGDYNCVTRSEVLQLMNGSASGRVKR